MWRSPTGAVILRVWSSGHVRDDALIPNSDRPAAFPWFTGQVGAWAPLALTQSPRLTGVQTKLRLVLDDIPTTLGVPFLNLIFKRLAEWPDVLIDIWTVTRDVVLTEQFAAEADRLAELAAPQGPVPTIVRPASMTDTDWRRAVLLTNAYRLVQPQLLLLVSGWAAASATVPDKTVARLPARLTPRSVPASADPAANVPMVPVRPGDLALVELFEQMTTQRGHPGLASYYRSLAQWPDLLQAVWTLIRPQVSTTATRQQHARLIAYATDTAVRLSVPSVQSLETGRREPAVHRLLEAWRDVQVPQLMTDTAYIGVALSISGSAN